jgi:hypothetical protein
MFEPQHCKKEKKKKEAAICSKLGRNPYNIN